MLKHGCWNEEEDEQWKAKTEKMVKIFLFDESLRGNFSGERSIP